MAEFTPCESCLALGYVRKVIEEGSREGRDPGKVQLSKTLTSRCPILQAFHSAQDTHVTGNKSPVDLPGDINTLIEATPDGISLRVSAPLMPIGQQPRLERVCSNARYQRTTFRWDDPVNVDDFEDNFFDL